MQIRIIACSNNNTPVVDDGGEDVVGGLTKEEVDAMVQLDADIKEKVGFNEYEALYRAADAISLRSFCKGRCLLSRKGIIYSWISAV